MFGQGRPYFVIALCATRAVVAFGFVAALFLLTVMLNQANTHGQDIYPLRSASLDTSRPLEPRSLREPKLAPDLSPRDSSIQRIRFRISWGGGTPHTWVGKVSVDNGSLSNVSPLGLTHDATASAIQVGNGMTINHWAPTNYGGADVTLEGTSQTEIHVLLTSKEQPETRFDRTITLEEIISGTVGDEIDLLGNRCSITRVPGDQLKVLFDREHLVFKPGETFQFTVVPNATALANRSAVCRVKLVTPHATSLGANLFTSTETLSFRMDKNGSAEPQEVNLTLPDEEAVYNVSLELETNLYSASFGGSKNSVSRDVQLLVLNEQSLDVRKPNARKQNWRQVSSIDPVDVESDAFPSWTQFSRKAGLSSSTLGNELRSPVTVGQQPMMRLEPGGWQAIPLSVDRLDRPHIVELEYVAESELAMGMSVLQPDATGQIPMYGFDSGVYVPKSLVSLNAGETNIRRHRITIWPKTKTPYLLVANRHATAGATIGKVTVFAGPDRIPSSGINARRLKADDSTTAQGSRKLMAFFEAPLFPESFGAHETIDPAMSEPLDDWRMFYEGADRFIEYLKANSYRGAFVTVACDGSSIYPSRLLSPSPKHDNGTFFVSGQDPIRKDILEMLFRMFEREGLVLVPTLALSGPLPEVESIRKRDGSDSEFELVDLNRATRQTPLNDQLPIYNPLNRTVQRAVRRIVQELAERYSTFDCFDGVAVICRPDTYTLLPGRQWGYDAGTVQQFIQLQPDLDSMSNPPSEIQSLLLGSHRKQWIDWRASQMTQWYEDIAAEVKRALPAGKLYLAPVDLYRNDEASSALSPSLHSSIEFEKVMLHQGFEAKLFSANKRPQGQSAANNIVLLQPHRIAPDQPLSSRRVDLAVEHSSQARQFFSSLDYAGDLYTHRISWAHFAQLQAQSPFDEQKSALMRLQQMTPAGSLNRKRFVESIKDHDARLLIDGGWMLTMGQEESLVEMMQVFSQLPDVRFDDVAAASQTASEFRSVAVRQLKTQDKSYFYVVNASPWPTRVTLNLVANSTRPNIESLSNQEFEISRASLDSEEIEPASRLTDASEQFIVNVMVPAYGLVGARATSDVLVSDFEFELPENADKDLRRHVYALQSKLTTAGNPQPLSVLENPDFEINGQPTLGGWDTGRQSPQNLRLDIDQNESQPNDRKTGAPRLQMGRASLLMSNETQSPIWVRSNFFESTETGRLSISVWLKTDENSAQPPLRLALEGRSNGSNYYRFGSVGSLSPDPQANQIETRWKRFAVHFDDLPVEGLANVRIGFDLMGPGQVNIDNVQVFDRWFDENDAKAITQLLASTGPLLSNPETFDSCRRLLEGYWPGFLDQFIEIDKPANQETYSDPSQRGPRRSGRESPSRMDASTARSTGNFEKEAERKVPMFRRFRNLVPQRKPTLR